MKEPTQEEIQECVNNAVKQTLEALMEDIRQSSLEVQAILQQLHSKYYPFEFDINVNHVKGLGETSHICYIKAKPI